MTQSAISLTVTPWRARRRSSSDHAAEPCRIAAKGIVRNNFGLG